jgi:tetratricopeptide (TPR) repeat protein
MGLAACRQLTRDYEGAVLCYSQAAILDVEDPLAPFHAAECYLAMKRFDEARSALFATTHWAGENPKWAKLRKRAEALLQLLEEKTTEEVPS